ncbi:hypothetical protein ACFWJU_06245 [Streptomyces mutabilis]|uniref:hypothetical protein n=1 Tax=Streptomyces mutabilis TaxID=67332 RepID=UPI0036568BE0
MAEESYPRPGHNNRFVTDIEYEGLAARFSDDGVYGDPTSPPVVTAGTGLSVNIRADVAASIRGHGWYSGTDVFSVPLSANISSQARTDWIVLRLDRSDWTVKAAAVGGTPGSGPPALTQQTGGTGVYEIPLAQVRILGGASSVTVTRAELYVGTRCRPCTSTTRNPLPRRGELAAETDTGRTMQWDGSAWQVFYSRTENFVIDSPLSAWSVLIESTLEERSGSVHVRLGAWQRKAGRLSFDTDSRLPVLIPAAYRHPYRAQYVTAYCSGTKVARITIYAANSDKPGQVWLTHKSDVAQGDYVWAASLSWGI